MKTSVKIEGLDQFRRNINKAADMIGVGVRNGLVKGGLKNQRDSQNLVPVDAGILKASAYTRADGTGIDTVVETGYTAKYAPAVHEAVSMKLKGLPRQNFGKTREGVAFGGGTLKGKFWDPQGRATAKFLEKPVRKNNRAVNEFVHAEIKRQLAKGIEG